AAAAGGAAGGSPARPAFVALVATASCLEDVPLPLGRCFSHTLPLSAPGPQHRELLLRHLLRAAAAATRAVAAAAGGAAATVANGDAASVPLLQQQQQQAGQVLPDGDAAVAAAVEAAVGPLVSRTAGLLPREL
ncbi:hypothetical protein Agub_g5781, partial [Astrephomene gubernaculifera]